MADNGLGEPATSASATLTVTTAPPAFTDPSMPRDYTAGEGGVGWFEVSLSGAPAPTVQWERSDDGGTTWTPIPGAIETGYRIDAVAPSDHEAQFRAVAVNAHGGPITSRAATLTVTTRPPSFLRQPADVAVLPGETATFPIWTNGDPAAVITWERSDDDGVTWTEIPGAGGIDNRSYAFTVAESDDGAQLRAVATNPYGTVTSDVAHLSVGAKAPTFTVQPVDTTGLEDGTVELHSVATGLPAPTYQWQSSDDGGVTWTDWPEATSSDLSITVASHHDGLLVRAVASNDAGTIPSDAARLSVSSVAPSIDVPPSDVSAFAGSTATVTATVTAAPAATFQWQSSTDGGATWADWTGEGGTEVTLSIPDVDAALDGTSFRVVATNRLGSATSAGAELHVVAPTGGRQLLLDPAGVVADTATTVTISGAGYLPAGGATGGIWLVLAPTSAWESGDVNTIDGAAIVWTSVSMTTLRDGNGFFTERLDLPALDAGTGYIIGTYNQSFADRSWDAFAPVPVTEPAPVVEITDAQLSWGYSRYAQYGVFGPWRQWTNGSNGVAVSVADGASVSGDEADAGREFLLGNFDGGTGTIDPETGAGTITWDTDDWVINAYPPELGAPDETYSDPILTIDEDGTGELSVVVYLPAHTDFLHGGWQEAVGPVRLVTATFSSATVDEGGLRLVPDFAGRPYAPEEGYSPWLACEGAGGSWPTALIDVLPASVRSHYYTTSCSGLNLMKPPLPIQVSWAGAAPQVHSTPSAPAQLLADEAITLRVQASGTPTPTVQWQRSFDGGETWEDLAGATGANHVRLARVDDDGAAFRALVSNAHGSVASGPTGVVSVSTLAPEITRAPSDSVVRLGESASFLVGYRGAPRPTATWERSDDGGATWSTDEDAVVTDASTGIDYGLQLRVEDVGEADVGAQFRAVVANGVGEQPTITTAAVTLTVSDGVPTIDSELIDRLSFIGQEAAFSARVTAIPGGTTAWERSSDGGETWQVIEDSDAPIDGGFVGVSLQVTPTDLGWDQNLFRVTATNSYGTAASPPARLTVLPTPAAPTLAMDPAGPFPVDQVNYLRNIVGGGYLADETNTGDVVVAITDVDSWQPGQEGTTAGALYNLKVTRAKLQESDGEWHWARPVSAGSFDPTKQYGIATFSSVPGERAFDAWLPFEVHEPPSTIEVTGAQLRWGMSQYAQYGVFGPWRQWTEGSDVAISTAEGQSISGDAADAGRTFTLGNFDGGTGTLDAVTGAGTITWDTGTWFLNAYPTYIPAPDESYSDPILTIDEDGSGELSINVMIPGHNDFLGGGGWVDPVGPERVVIATFADVHDRTGTGFAITPDFAGRPYEHEGVFTGWQSCEGAGGSWPTSFIDFLPSSLQPHYYTTSCSGLNLKKPALPIEVSWAEIAPEIVTQPTGPTGAIAAGDSLGLSLAVTGTPTPRVQWQRSTDGGTTWTDVVGGTGSAYPLAASVADDGAQLRAVAGNAHGSVTSDVVGPFEITTLPAAFAGPGWSADGQVGQPGRVGITVQGAPRPTVTWERSDDGGATWVPAEGAAAEMWSGTTGNVVWDLPPLTVDDIGDRYRVTITNGLGDPVVHVSEPIELIVRHDPPVLESQPTSGAAFVGQSVTFYASATVIPGGTVVWQRSTDGGATWTDEPGTEQEAASDNLWFEHRVTPASAEEDGDRYRLALTNDLGQVHSDEATLTVVARGEGQQVVVLPSASVDPDADTTLTVLGAGFDIVEGSPHVRLALIDAAAWQPGRPGNVDAAVVSSYWTTSQLTSSGGFGRWEVTVAAGTLDPTTSYGVATFGWEPEQRGWDTWTPLSVVQPEPEPDLEPAHGLGTWGIRDTYRNYINGPIAHGITTVDEGAQWLEGPDNAKGPFTWPVRSGEIDPATRTGEIRFDGSVFTGGHDYGNGFILESTWSDLRLIIDGDVGTLQADLVFRPFGGADPTLPPPAVQTANDVAFATVDLSTATWPSTADGTLVITAAPATGVASTMELIGWDAFYSGEMPDVRIDPLSVTFTAGEEQPVVWEPQITVSQTTGLDRGGAVVTVTGSGFDPAANVGTRPPLAGQETGVYVVFGRFGDPWKPSVDAPSSARSSIAQLWVLPAASRALVDPTGTDARYATLAEDGTFEVTLALTMDESKTGTYGVATYAAGGPVNASQELLTPVTFADPPAPEPFVDVPEDDIFFADVMWAVSEGITTGYTDGTFGPTLSTTRQTAAAFLYRLAGSPAVAPGAPVFADVPADSVFRDAISWLASEGITTGYTDGTFRPTDVVSRQSMAAFLHRSAGSPAAGAGGPVFADVPADSIFHEAISWLASEGITTGYTDGTFRPTDVVSRQAMVAFLHRYASL